MVRGPCPVLSPFLGCLSGSSELAWGFVKLLRTYEVRFFCFGMRSSSWPLPWLGALGYSMLCFFLERGWGVLCFRHKFCGEDSGPSLAPWFAGFTVPAQPMGDRYILCGRSGVTWSTWAAYCRRCERFPFAVGCKHEGVIEDHCLLLAPDAVVTGVLTLGHGTACFMSLELFALVLPLRLFFVKNFAVILMEGRECGSRALPCEAT